ILAQCRRHFEVMPADRQIHRNVLSQVSDQPQNGPTATCSFALETAARTSVRRFIRTHNPIARCRIHRFAG
ncbi:MAG TPA: hypothetical protein VFK10_03035, partial [Burkholderiaceae bacterium]|nr:hypothetical protein [Burkholderiaceae bacterium]